MRFGIVANTTRPNSLKLAKDIIAKYSNELDMVIEETLAKEIGIPGVELEKMEADALLVVGGDGTILRCLQKCDLPVFGIKTGDLGFLTETGPEGVEKAITRITSGNFHIEERSRLETSINGNKIVDSVNELVISTAQVAKMRHFLVFVDGKEVADLRADGVIIATTTGSTSYAMSAGGPLVDPRVRAFIFVPIAPFKLSARPLVIPIESQIEIRIIHPQHSVLVADGQFEVEVGPDDRITCSLAKKPARFIKFNDDFYTRMSQKLGG